MKFKLISVIVILGVLFGSFASLQGIHRVQAAGPECKVDDTATGTNSGSSWTDAYTDLQSALSDSGCTQILVAAGTYRPDSGSNDRTYTFQLRSGVSILGGYPDGGGTRAPETYVTILSGDIRTPGDNTDDTYHVVTGSGVDSTAVLDGFTIKLGYADSSPNSGGGVYISGGSPTLQNLVISGNHANGSGGGIFLINSNSALNNVTISGNDAATGGGLSTAGTGSPDLTSVYFNNNSGTDGGGAAISGSANLNGVEFNSNFAKRNGGGLFITSGSAALANVTFNSNEAGNASVPGFGGGMYIEGGATPSLTAVTFTSNSANLVGPNGGRGGGMYILNSAPILSDVGFSSNTADIAGGGLYINGGNADLDNVTLFGNQAGPGLVGGNGGGMYITGSGSPTLTTVLFTANEANPSGSTGGNGGGLYTDGGSAVLNNATFSHNIAGADGGGLRVGGDILMTDSLIEGNEAGSEGGGLTLPLTGVSAEFINLSVRNNSVNPATGNGGGIYTYANAPSFTNLLLAGNSAYQGGGMANYGYSDPMIVNATIYGNHSTNGGSAFLTYNSGPTLANSIVWGNTETIPGPDFVGMGITDFPIIHNSILEGGCPFITCTNLVSGDPRFVDPTNGDFRLPPDSPALDAGDASLLPADSHDLDGDGNLSEPILIDRDSNRRVVVDRVDLGMLETQIWNTNWTEAARLSLAETQLNVYTRSVDRYLERQGQSRWFKFAVQPSSKVLVTLTGLPANYDLALYQDISQAYSALDSSRDLVQLSAEFAPDTFSPDTFSPDTFSPDTFSPDTFSPDTFSPDTFSPDTFSPDTFSPDTFSPDTFSPDTFSPDTFSPDTFSPDTFSPDTFSPDTFSPDTFSPDTFSPDTFSSAQTRSLIAVSAHEGTQGEGIIVNTWTKSGEYYVRVRGRNGAFNADAPFHLQVNLLSGACGPVSPVLPATSIIPLTGDYQTLILTNLSRTEGNTEEKALLQTKLSALAARTSGWVVDVGADARVSAASGQAQAHPACVYAMNLQAEAIKNIVDGFRELNPGLEYVVLVGNDHAIPFFRYADNALLASEIEYSPPVQDNTTSQASLKSGYTLSQDAYGSSVEVSYKSGTLPVPDLAVGRLVETASDINRVLDAYLGTADGVIYPTNALVTGYDFLEDAANAVRDELQASLGETAVDTLIMDSALSPQDPLAWTAADLRNSLLDSSHDIVFLAGHFSANGALAADYQTRLMAGEVLASSTDFTNSLVYSAGCHSGYNIVNEDGVPNVTEEPDWAQAFAGKGATFVGGTGYQYGDTEFIEYSERLYLEFTRQLRYGSGPVAVGKALTQAKQAYLASTPLMRGIHEKSVLEATLFGLPMLQFELAGRIPAPVDISMVTGTTTFTDQPGSELGLEYTDLHLTPEFTDKTVILDQISGNGETTTVNAVYLEGPDGVMVNPAEPVLPLDMLNVTSPEAGFVLRGAGWRGGEYSDLPDQLPLTGAATDDLRAPHMAFFSDVFYPIRPWNINYFDALGSSAGPTRLALMPAQYRSAAPGSLTGVLRRFNAMDFRLYYSSNIDSYTNNEHDWTNTPALSAPPDISHLSSSINSDGTVSFEITVTGDPAAGIQEAWIVYTFENGGLSGAWLPLDLEQDQDDTRLWIGSLNLGSNSGADLRFIVQAVNGVGLVTMMTNDGAFYQAGVDPAALPQGQDPVMLTLEQPSASGPYGGQQAFTAIITQNNTPLVSLPVLFTLGGKGRLAVTGSYGRASVNFFLASQPGDYTLNATFSGNDAYAPANSSSTFEIEPGSSVVVLEPDSQKVPFLVSTQYIATVTSSGLPLVGKPVALTLDAGVTRLYTSVAVTDYAGQARWQVPGQPLGNYTLTAWFGQEVSSGLDLSSPYYMGSDDTASLAVMPLIFSGFFPPVDNLPVINKVKAGSAVPVKFSLGGDFGLKIFASGFPTLVKTICQTGNIDPIETTVSAGASSLTYDPLTGRYMYVWKTDKKWAGACGSLVLKFINGTEKSALFQFTK